MTVDFKQIPNLVDQAFKSKSASSFWHYTIKNCRKEKDFADEALIESRIKTIAAKLGSNSFQRQDEFGMTPLHVAAVTGNAAGLGFLLKSNVEDSVKDNFGNKAIDYVRQFHPELLEHFALPHSCSEKIKSILKPVFEKWSIKLPPMKYPNRQHTDDFGRIIKSILLGSPIEDKPEARGNTKILKDLQMVCHKLGIQTRGANLLNHIRDFLLIKPDGEFLRSAANEHIAKAIERSESKGLSMN